MPRVQKPRSVLKKEYCKNCGSTEHRTRDCLQRPRKNKIHSLPKDSSNATNSLSDEDRLKLIQELQQQNEDVLFPVQTKENEIKEDAFLTSKDEENKINDDLGKKRMAIKNNRRRDDVAPYLKDLDGGDSKVEREIADMSKMWDEAKEGSVFDKK